MSTFTLIAQQFVKITVYFLLKQNLKYPKKKYSQLVRAQFNNMANIRQDILEADDQMFVIADGKADTANIAAVQTAQSKMQLAAAADKSNKSGKCPQLKCEDIFYMSSIKKCKYVDIVIIVDG